LTNPRVILCGGVQPTGALPAGDVMSLNLHGGKDANVHLKLSDISSAMASNVPGVLVDLIELAAYVFAADQAVTRGSARDTGERWRRRYQFHVPVRNPALWSKPEVTDALIDVLSFLSDDDYSFSFSPLLKEQPIQLYLEIDDKSDLRAIEHVLLFSGGADSLAGAVQAALVDKKNVALISHRSAAKRVKKVDWLASKIAERAAPRVVKQIAVWATKDDSVGREFTQRSRSFLYASLATTVASMLGLDRINFYENGVTSINLPIASQVVGGRATRTTHPITMAGFAQLFSLILEKPFHVETPFLWKTKTEIMRVAKDNGCGDLLPTTVSCSRTVEATKLHTHCGRCSQCIDRRFGALAAGLTNDEDPEEMYKVDLLRGERPYGEDRAMAETFVQRAKKFNELDDINFFTQFPEANRVIRHVGLTADAAAQRVLDLHRRHGKEVMGVLADGLRANVEDFQAGRLPNSCLLVLPVPDSYRAVPAAKRFTDSVDPTARVAVPEQQTATPTDKGPAFLCEGATWRVSFENETGTVKDCTGMRYIARLLETPGREWHCAEMLAVDGGQPYTPPPVSAGDASDLKSIKDYRRRLDEIETEIMAAQNAGNPESVLALKEEGERIEKHLTAVTTRTGGARKASDDNEQARKAVGNAITRAMNAIDRAKQAPLWRHLKKNLNLGNFCSYQPEQPVTWHVKLAP